jgi:dCMP deaminase
MTRPSWSAYFIGLAHAAATRATCPRLSVGCIIELDRQVLVTGFNGAARGAPECSSVGCQLSPSGGCVRTVHAEANAVAMAARRGVALGGATAWLTDSPCMNCAMLLYQAGITGVRYDREYRITESLDFLRERGVTVERVTE